MRIHSRRVVNAAIAVSTRETPSVGLFRVRAVHEHGKRQGNGRGLFPYQAMNPFPLLPVSVHWT